MMVFCTIPARLFGGIVADRVPKDRLQILMAGALFLQVIGIGSYLLYPGVITVYVLLICHGLSSGGLTPVVLLIVGRYFGRRAFGSIFGTMAIFFAPLGFLGPIYYGWIFDATGSYNVAFITVLALALVAAAVTVFVRPPAAPLRDDSQSLWPAG
jgi:cyanate permease